MLTIGLVNNMSVAAIEPTERQFREVLHEAARDAVQLRWFRLGSGRPAHYEPIEALWGSRVDGLIVTGSEPKAPTIPDEPIYPLLVRTIDWAAENTVSTVFSCLAAHAAVQYLDNVERCPHAEKIFGVFESIKVTEHALLADTPDSWRVPHSRWNDLPEAALRDAGYTVLTKSNEAGVDLFVKPVKQSLFFFIQTHPEYFPKTLLREWWRDITRYHSGQQSQYPAIPKNCLPPAQAALLTVGPDHRLTDAERVASVRLIDEAEVSAHWKPIAVQLYRNWLNHLALAGALA